MKIFTNKGFQEEICRRLEAKEEADYVHRRLTALEERIESLYIEIGNLKYTVDSLSEKNEKAQKSL